jgi:glycosyltransferase involved in cell wall biosynthesis
MIIPRIWNMQAEALEEEAQVARGRILFLTSCPEPWGGSEELWAGAACRLQARGFRVQSGRSDFWHRGPLHARLVELRKSGVGVRNFSVTSLERVIPDGFQRFFPPIAHKVFGARNRWLALKIRKLRPDLVVISQGGSYDGFTVVDVPLICQRARVPYVLICQKSAETDWPADQIRDGIRARFLRAERVFFVSVHNQRVTNQQLGITVEHGEVVRNPYMIKINGPLPWPALGPEGRYQLACVGRMYPREKGQDILLNVLARERWQARPFDVDFYGEGQQAQGLEEMARFLGLRNVRFRGFSHEIAAVWREHHALILCSRSEGLPLAQVEAMICGRPVIAAPAGGIAEILHDGETGFLASSATEDALDDALERAWQRRPEWEAMGQSAAQLIKGSFPGDPCAVFADKLEVVYKSVIARRHTRATAARLES